VSGSSLFKPWFPQWLLELAVAKSAIIVSPNYRLLPESSGLDILDDLNTFWKWLHSDMRDVLKTSGTPGLKGDLNRIITEGDSAGTLS
jgi:acetyl esterase/lipase